MSILALTSNTLTGTAGAGQIEYDGQFYGTDSNASRAQLQRIVRATAVTSTSGTSIDFTGLPAWVEKITVMLSGVSTTGTSGLVIQIGDSGGVKVTGYVGQAVQLTNTAAVSTSSLSTYLTCIANNAATDTVQGVAELVNLTGNIWVYKSTFALNSYNRLTQTTGTNSLTGTLDRVRITTSNGTDTFDAGSINIIYEG